MRASQRSLTAEGTCALRAAHLLLDDDPPILDDQLARRLLGSAWQPEALRPWAQARKRLNEQLFSGAPAWAGRFPNGTRRLRAQVVVRSRYVEDQLRRAMERGVEQYVILGAGLDTFGLRSEDLASRLTVFEVDHPETQVAKMERLAAADLDWPEHVVRVPIDFEREALGDVLARSPHDAAKPTFFSWLGVTYYLTEGAIRSTFALVAKQPSGSEIAFDFWSKNEPRQADRALLRGLRFSVAGVGERMLSFFSPESMRELLAECGLDCREILGRDGVSRRYLRGRRDGLLMPDFSFLANARVD